MGAGADMGVSGTTGRAPGGLGLQYQGHCGHDGPVTVGECFMRVWEMEAGRASRDRDVVRRHRMMGQRSRRSPEVEPEHPVM